MEEKTINISAVQMCAETGSKEANFEKLKKLLANIKKTDVIVLPEVWAVGWSCADFRKNAEEIETSETVEFLSEIARTFNANIIGGSFIRKTKDGIYYNSCPVLNRDGKTVALYDKNHLYSYYGCDEGKFVTAGKNPVMVNLDGINFGLTICYDIRFPEIYRAYRKAGADVLINCAAWASTKPVPWEMMTKSRAIENQTFTVAVNQFGPMKNNETNLGHSRIIDYNGNVLSEISDGEGVIQADLNFNEMYAFREKCTVLKDIKESYEVKICGNY